MTVPRSLTQRDVLLRSARFALLGALRLSQMRHHWLQHLREGAWGVIPPEGDRRHSEQTFSDAESHVRP